MLKVKENLISGLKKRGFLAKEIINIHIKGNIQKIVIVTTLKTLFEKPLQEGLMHFSTLFSEKTLLDFQKMDIYCNVQNAIYRERSIAKKCRAFF